MAGKSRLGWGVITVAILINGQPIYTRSAVRTETKGPMGYYKSDDGKTIQHPVHRGAVPLAIKMLKAIQEQERGSVDGGCNHEWVNARNKAVQKGWLCLKCNAITGEDPNA